MSKVKLNLTSVKNKFLLANRYYDKSMELRRKATKDAKNIIEKSDLLQSLGDYLERVEVDFDAESCNSYYLVIDIFVTKDTPEEVKKRLEDTLISTLPDSAIEVNTTNRTSRKKGNRKRTKTALFKK